LSNQIKKMFFGTPSSWYIGGEITEKNRIAIIEWLDDRQKFHIWLTSIVSGGSVFISTFGKLLESDSPLAIIRLIGLGVMMLSILINLISIGQFQITN
jgi:hypothetical protein